VAETALAVSVSEIRKRQADSGAMDVDAAGRQLRLVSVRTIDPPSRLTPPGVPSTGNAAGNVAALKQRDTENQQEDGIWRAPLGGTKFAVIDGIIQAALQKGGLADEVLDGLDGVELS
jgi:exosome complex component RRP42